MSNTIFNNHPLIKNSNQYFLEKKYNTSLDKLLKKTILDSIGANYTTYNPLELFNNKKIVPSEIDNYFRKDTIVGYVHDMGAAMQGGIGGHAGLFSNSNDVAKIMQKYDLEAIPVVDELGRLVGRITIDDIVDVIKEEAEKDYQMAAGISQDVEADDTIWELTKARLPWLILALFGGFVSVSILGGFQGAMTDFPVLFFFTPLIAAMAGNVGVQSSAIIVQGLANDSLRGSAWNRLLKEVSQSLINGFVLAALLMSAGMFFLGFELKVGITVAVSLISVIIIASIIGTFVPIILDKRGIDPALATGPFITTSNDILGILIYFSIAKLILGF